LQKLAVAILPSWFLGLAVQQWIGTPIELGRFPTRMKLLQLDAEAPERCREEDTSVTALVSTAVAMAIMRGAAEGWAVAASIAISSRRCLPRGAAQPVGVMATSVNHTYCPLSEAPENDIWALAAGARSEGDNRRGPCLWTSGLQNRHARIRA
jgi:post-segregation antitoxin (ccd killing protein)